MAPVIGAVISAVAGFFGDRAKIKQAKVEGQIAITKKAAEDVGMWERLMAQGTMSSLKDEWVLFMFSIPFVLGFIKTDEFDGPQIVTDGFIAFAGMPEWYTYTFVTICLASFGIRVGDRIKNALKK